MYLDHKFGLRLSHHFTFWLKSGLRPNFSSSRGSAKG